MQLSRADSGVNIYVLAYKYVCLKRECMYVLNADYIASVPIYSANHVSSYHSRDPDDRIQRLHV